jgi:nitroreductase
MNIPFSTWYPAIEKRRSRRHFEASRPIEPEKLSALDLVCKQFVPFPGARSFLVNEPGNDVFKGAIGSYGKVKSAPAFVAFIGDMERASVQEETGYTGEGIILEATALGLDTCWVGGFFKPESVSSLIPVKSNERVLAVSPVGYAVKPEALEEELMTGFGRSHRRVPISKLVNGLKPENMPEWVRVAVQAGRLAPSAVNRQPWGFEVQDKSITVYVRTGGPEFNVSKRLDCGIAMMHIEIAVLNLGMSGKWELLDAPRVAKFSVLAY